MSVLRSDSNGQQALVIVPGTNQTVAFTGTSAQSAAFAASTSIIRVVASEACFLVFGADPTATTGGMFLPSGVVEYFAVTPGQKVAAIQASTGGSLYITEVSD